MFDIRAVDLDKLNSLTKYPSIPTYHKIGDKGILQEENIHFGEDERIYITEKLDGTNSRIILTPDCDYIIGSREELLFARTDIVRNPTLGIVSALKDFADKIYHDFCRMSQIIILYSEVFGGNVNGSSKNYTSKKEYSFRIFDIAVINDYEKLLEMPREEIASWRDRGG